MPPRLGSEHGHLSWVGIQPRLITLGQFRCGPDVAERPLKAALPFGTFLFRGQFLTKRQEALTSRCPPQSSPSFWRKHKHASGPASVHRRL